MSSKKEKPFRAAVYVRRKFKDVIQPGEEDLTTAQQVSKIKELKDEFPDVSIEAVYMDRKRMNKDDARPEFMHFLKDLHAGHYNCVILYSIDTFGKDKEENSFYLLKQFPMLRLRIILIHENYDSELSEPIRGEYTRLLPLIDRSILIQHSRKLVARNRRNKETAIVSGGYTPYGYLFNPDIPECIEPDPVCAPAIQLIFDEYISGTPRAAIIDILHQKGYPTPSERKIQLGYWSTKHQCCHYWTDGAVSSLLRKQVYTGDLVMKDFKRKVYLEPDRREQDPVIIEVVENHHEALISKEVFEKAQIIFETSASQIRNTQNQGRKQFTYNPLHTLVYCGSCGMKMSHLKYNQKGRYGYGVFRCPSVRDNRPNQCLVPNYRDDELIAMAREAIDENRKLALQFQEELQSEGENTVYAKGLSKYEQKIHALTDELSGLYQESDSLSDEKKNDCKTRLLELINQKRNFYNVMSMKNSWLRRYLELMDGYDFTKEIARTFIQRITVYQDQPPQIILKDEDQKDQLLQLYKFAMDE